MSQDLTTQPRVMIIEDDRDVGDSLTRALVFAGMTSAVAQSGQEAVTLKRHFRPDVVLVDLHLPDTSGASLVKWLVAEGDCGIIIVSGDKEDTERIVNLELGAYDYIEKPPKLRELVARIRAVHRRVGRHGAADTATGLTPGERPSSVIKIGPLRVDASRRKVLDENGQILPLTGAEFEALLLLIEAAGRPVSREHLSETALRRPWRAEDRSTDQLVFSLRRKIGDETREPRLIQSVRGAGYVLAETPHMQTAGPSESGPTDRYGP